MIKKYIWNADFEDTGFSYTLSLISGKHKMVILYCLMEFGIVTLAGWIFRWYTTREGYLVVMLFYFLIYGFVWMASIWMQKVDEDKINQALKEIQDEE